MHPSQYSRDETLAHLRHVRTLVNQDGLPQQNGVLLHTAYPAATFHFAGRHYTMLAHPDAVEKGSPLCPEDALLIRSSATSIQDDFLGTVDHVTEQLSKKGMRGTRHFQQARIAHQSGHSKVKDAFTPKACAAMGRDMAFATKLMEVQCALRIEPALELRMLTGMPTAKLAA